jgi:glucose-6-phosphate isomerase
VPAALAGVDVAPLLDQAAALRRRLAGTEHNPALDLGLALGAAWTVGRDKIVIADTGSGIVGFGDWAEQLIAESTGKDGKGLLPVVVEGVTAPGFSDANADAVQVILGPEPDRVSDRAVTAFGANVQGPLGAQFLLWEYTVAIASRLIGINPFDQPNVEAAKQQARQLLSKSGEESPDPPAFVDGVVEVRGDGVELASATKVAEAVRALIGALPDTGYLSVQAYLDRLADSSAADLRETVASLSGLQTTFGWGPRFLHSTGQYHKGGHPNGGFLQITAGAAQDVAIPDRPYTFATLQQAQAAGDALVLAGAGRPVLRLHLTDREAGLGMLLQEL